MKKALVIGGGVAGPVVAMALRQAGMEATVYEAYRVPAHGVGGGLALSTNALAALQQLDALKAVTAAGYSLPYGMLALGNGRRLGGETAGTPLPDGTTMLSLLRADLYAALTAQARDRDIPIEYGKRLVGVEHQGDHVVAEFADGTRAAGDLLIGADGMRSAVRGLVDGAAPAPEYCGIVGTGGVAPDPGIDCEPGVFTMVFGRNGFFGYSRNPADDGIWWFVNLPWRHEPSVAELSAIGDEVWQRRLVELFSADDSPAVRVIEATPARYEWSVMHQMAAPRRWFRERMVLIGDAAHVTSPSSGQGAGMAIEDAVELARCLRDFPETESAFLAYQRLRESRVKKVHDGARRINRSKSATGMARVVRDALFPVMMKKFGKPGSFDWLYEHRIDFDARVGPALGVR